MTINRNMFMLLLAGVLFGPLTGRADQCDDVFAQGAEKFDAAIAAGQKNDFESAIRLYGEAEKSYKQVSAMPECGLRQIAITAARNVGICRSNAGKLKKGLEKVQSDNKEAAAAAAYNQATEDYNRGVAAFNNREWDEASDALESAAAVWESISSSKTETGRLSAQYALKARKMAELARQYKYQE